MIMVLSYGNPRSREPHDHLGSNRRFHHDPLSLCAEHGRGRHLGPRAVRQRPLAGSAFKKRLVQIATVITANPQHSLPKACDRWADLKAAYRFLSNMRVQADAIQEPHREQTRARCVEHPVVLCLQDTSELDFTRRRKVRDLGPIGDGRGRGLLQHTALAVTPGPGGVGCAPSAMDPADRSAQGRNPRGAIGPAEEIGRLAQSGSGGGSPGRTRRTRPIRRN